MVLISQKLLFSPKMKRILILNFFKVLISQQTPQLCSKAAEYSNCALNATLQVAACNQNVDSNPDSKYYTCLCDGYQTTLKCYSLCPDDPQLQLQFRTQQRSTSSTCKAAGDMKLKEPESNSSTASPMSLKTTLTSTSLSISEKSTTSFAIGQSSSPTTSGVLGVGGSRAMTPETFTMSEFPFLSGSAGYQISIVFILIVAIAALTD